MATTQIHDFLNGEGLLAISPELRQQVDAGWLQRLSLFTGRTLRDTALIQEQAYRAGRLTMLGQAVTQGVVQGLALTAEPGANPMLTLTPGYGITAAGQDVALLRPLRASLNSLAVLEGDSGAFLAALSNFTLPTQPWLAVLVLQPIVAEVSGSAVDTGTGNIIVSGNPGASCDPDPAENAFGDSQLVDAARLALVTWPSTFAVPPAAPIATWRNRLAYTIFEAAAALGSDHFLPWEFYGVPVALAAFDASSALLFTDRGSVVRTGGLPRRRYLRPLAGGVLSIQPSLASARLSQFAEQLSQGLMPASPPTLVAGEFALLPPAGVLPAYTIDFVNQKAFWCPSNWTVSVAPVLAEELEGEVRAAMTAAPLDVARAESIRILVPLPDAVYDPDILLSEAPSPEFQAEVDASTLQRNIVLQHRFVIQREANALAPLTGDAPIDMRAGLTADEGAGLTAAAVFAPLASESFGTTPTNGVYVSDEVTALLKQAAAAPFTVTVNNTQVPFFKPDDLNDLQTNGIQHFIDRINARLNRANDVLDLAFLTSQTDIYRYRQNVLNTVDASRLAVSPILANIASGDTAAATAQNIRDYLGSLHVAASTGPGVATPDPANAGTANPGAGNIHAFSIRSTSPVSSTGFLNVTRAAISTAPVKFDLPVNPRAGVQATISDSQISHAAVSVTDITHQAPIVGAQLNLRTLTIAERLAPSRAQEAMFYSIGNRVSVMQILADLEITIDDLAVPLDLPADKRFFLADIRASAAADRRTAVFQALNAPQITAPANSNPDEGALFSTGVHVLEQHSQLLRAIEGRIQQYRDFLNIAAAALGRIQKAMEQAQSLLVQLNNDLTQARQNLAFVQALFADEQARVATVNNRRADVLRQYVKFVAYARPRTALAPLLQEAPSRQLVPATVASPVPACLKQSVSIPAELREVIGLLREAPVRWFPPIFVHLPKLERPALLQDLAVSARARAALQLALPLSVSSADSAGGRFAPAVSTLFSANQSVVRSLQLERASFNPQTLVAQSWSSQVDLLSGVAAIGDLLQSASVHPEISNAASRSLQQISSVATCLYTRVGQALPVDRLEWAEFLLHGTVNLRNLAVLPGWNKQSYIDRQQTQLLVDWLFQQVDSDTARAVSLMNDVIAVAILLASQAPVDDIIAGAIALRATPVIGHPIRLTLPSDRIAHGMQVSLYSAGELAARAVVSDLDHAGVTATVTEIYKPGASLQPNDLAHFTALDRNAVAFRAFSL